MAEQRIKENEEERRKANEKRRKDDELRIIELMSEQNKREEAGRWYTDKPY